MPRTLLRNARIIDPEGAGPDSTEPRPDALLLEGDRIAAVMTRFDAGPTDARAIDLAGAWLAPGLIDLHHHGSAIFHVPSGRTATGADRDALRDALRADAASCVRHGTTAFLPTSVAWPMTQLGEFVTQVAATVSGMTPDGAQAIGVHLEGPWINPGAAGAQPPAGIGPYREAEAADLLERGHGVIRMVTYAPEIQGADALQAALTQRGILGALGHSLAGAELVTAAADRGARHVTHLFNAMGAFHHRTPGLAAAALSDERLSCDLICDGAHVHARVVDLAARAAGSRIVLITDRVDPPRSPADSFGSGSLCAAGETWRLADGRLAGSRLTLDAALRNWMEFTGATLTQAVAACTLRPARALGIEAERGSLRPGARADLVVLDPDLAVRETWVAGRCVYRA